MNRLTKIMLLALGLLFLTFLFAPVYLRNALTYYTADIDDYKIFENRQVLNGAVTDWELHQQYNTLELNDSLEQKIDAYKPVAMLLAQKGEILYEKYWDGYSAESYSNSFSVAKSIISLLVGVALEEGDIKSLDEPVAHFLPAFDTEQNRQLTIRHLLSMSSGLNWDESYGSPFSVTTQAYYGTDLPALINQLQVVESPGKEWKYLSGNTQVLAMILEQATGQKVSEYASEKLWKPLGTSAPALWSLDRADGLEKAYCCFNSNARDFARLGQLILQNGRWKGEQLVSEDYLQEALAPASFLKDEEGDSVDFYGYQWWVVNYKGQAIPYARGILGQYIFILPEQEAVFVRLGHERDPEYQDHHPKDVYLYLDAAYALLEQ